jgi:uncharacterized membrane protein
MKKWILWTALATLVFALAVHLAVVAYIPYKAMDTVMNVRFKELPYNALVSGTPITVESRNVVRPSPDLLYSVCKYDVSQRPLLITCPLPEGYWSASFYADNTDNFFAINDMQVKSLPVKLLLVGKNSATADTGDAIVVRAQSDKGLVLIRMLVSDAKSLPALIGVQQKAACKQLD